MDLSEIMPFRSVKEFANSARSRECQPGSGSCGGQQVLPAERYEDGAGPSLRVPGYLRRSAASPLPQLPVAVLRWRFRFPVRRVPVARTCLDILPLTAAGQCAVPVPVRSGRIKLHDAGCRGDGDREVLAWLARRCRNRRLQIVVRVVASRAVSISDTVRVTSNAFGPDSHDNRATVGTAVKQDRREADEVGLPARAGLSWR